MPTVEELLDEAEDAISRSKAVDLWRASDARVNAEELMSEVLGKQVVSEDLEDRLVAKQAARYRSLLARRVAGEPVAMILGTTEFMGLDMKVRKGVFIPRNSSELLAGEAIRRLRGRSNSVAVDVATGSGPVALAVAHALPQASVWGVDISTRALKLAQENAKKLRIPNVRFLKSDMLKALPSDLKGRVDAFTIHPPYVASWEIKLLPTEIRDFEPVHTLTDRSNDGLDLVRKLGEDAADWLRPGGWVLVEVSPNLSRRVKSILHRAGIPNSKSIRDSLGATRVVCGSLSRLASG